MIETPGNFDNISSVRDREAVLIDPTQNENEMQVWTQRVTDNLNKGMAELRKEMNEKLEKMMIEVKNSRRTQSIPSKRNNGQTTSRIETPKLNTGQLPVGLCLCLGVFRRLRDLYSGGLPNGILLDF